MDEGRDHAVVRELEDMGRHTEGKDGALDAVIFMA